MSSEPGIAPQMPALARRSRVFAAQPTRLIGREGELDQACRTLLRDEVRLLTFRGPAGVGKTRLALATADSLRDVFDDVFVVDLAVVAEFSQVGAAIAHAVGMPTNPDQPLLASLASRLANSTTLLILDNFEHVMPAADFLVALLALCPSVTTLVTSREALRLRWEYVFPVRPLALPEPQAVLNLLALLDSPAVKLFVDRAQAADPSFDLTIHNAAAVAEVCVRLDGLPLAIELAAARSPFLPPRAMLAQMHRRLDLLADGASDLPERQRSARAAIGYSYHLLSAPEQALFRQLSVFATGCTPEAAAAVALGVFEPANPAVHEPAWHGFSPIHDSLSALAQKSLLFHETLPSGEVRFRMLETLRAFADEQLQASGELGQTRARALAYYTALAHQAQPGLQGRHQTAWLGLLDREHDNMNSLLKACAGTELAGLAATLDQAVVDAQAIQKQPTTLDQTVLYAASAQDHATPAQPPTLASSQLKANPFAWLTRREQEVASLLLRGLSNRQIAELLVVTERTAETHVCRILSKLGLGSRAQISAWFVDQQAGR